MHETAFPMHLHLAAQRAQGRIQHGDRVSIGHPDHTPVEEYNDTTASTIVGTFPPGGLSLAPGLLGRYLRLGFAFGLGLHAGKLLFERGHGAL